MKSRLWIIGAAAAALPAAAQAGNVEVEIEGVRAGGTLYVSLQQREEFLSDDQAYRQVIANPEAGTLKVTLPDVAPGDYAVLVWHDDDGNGQFDMQPGAPPLDGWSMVGAASLMGMPNFDHVKTSVGPEGAEIPLSMLYGRAAQ